MLRSLNATNGNKRSLTRDSLWGMSAQLNKPMPPLPMSHRREVMVVRGPPVITLTNAKRMETIINAKAKAKTLSVAPSRKQ
eukprot:6780338-Pyramimonas_sp.AAC.1